jgi:hypothetical protein
MAEPLNLEAVLTRTALALPGPSPDDMARAVGQRLRTEPGASGRAAPWRRPLIIAVAAVVVLGLVVALLPPARSAVADFLGIGGIRVQSVSTSPAPSSGATSTFASTPSDPYAGLHLGRAVTLDEARAAVDFPVKLPTAPGYGPPDAVYLGTPPPDGMVSVVYAPASGRPAPPTAPIGVLLSEFRADVDFAFIKKLTGPGTTVQFVTVGGAEAVWISGPAHSFGYVNPDGTFGTESLRLAANTLLWVRDGVTYRLESALDRDAAIALALTLR